MRSLKSVGSALSVLTIALVANASNAWADFVTFTATNGSNLSASVTFETSGSNLIVTLTNTSTADVTASNQVLTAVFFSLPGSLTPVSAVVNEDNGSTVYNGTSTGDSVFPDVAGEWAYASGLSMSWGSNSGISSSGLGVFGPGNTFSDLDLDAPDSPNGINYGITSAGDNTATANGGLEDEPLIQNSVVFTLSGWDEDWSISDIMYVVFQYGTSLSEPQLGVPEPGVLALLGVGLVGLVFAFRKYSWA